MSTYSTNAGCHTSTTHESNAPPDHGKANLFLASGILCFGVASFLGFFQKEFTSHGTLQQFSVFLEALADKAWSLPSALGLVLIIVFISLLHYYAKVQEKGIYLFGCRVLPVSFVFIKWLFLFLLFTYTIFPLTWAQRAFTRSIESFPDYIFFDAILLILNLMGICFCSLYCFAKLPARLCNLTERASAHFFQWKERYFLGSLLALCFLATTTIAYTVLGNIPHVPDSIAQLFQAKIFKMGKLYAPLPSHKEFFDYLFILNESKWYSQYPPGHSVLLMVGLFLETPWLIGPVMGTLSLLTFYLFIKNIYKNCHIAYLGTTLLFLSPFFLFMSSTYMNHTSTLLAILSFLLFYTRIFSSHSLLPCLISGLSLGYAINIRPLTAAAIGLPFICDLIIRTYKKRESTNRQLLVFLSGLFLVVCLLLAYNDLTNDNPLLFGYQKKHGTLGFLGSAQEGPPHTLKGGVINTSNNLIGLNKFLFEWPVPSLLFAFILFASPIKKNRWDCLFLLSSLSLVASYAFYYFQDYCFGPRFYYCLLPFIIVLTVRGFYALPQWLEQKHFSKRKVEASLSLLLLLCFFYTFSSSFPKLIKKYSDDYWDVTDKIHKAIQKQEITNAIVFIDCWYPPERQTPNLIYYGSGFQFNSPDLNNDVIYTLDLKEKNVELMKAFPHRTYYRCNVPWDRNGDAW